MTSTIRRIVYDKKDKDLVLIEGPLAIFRCEDRVAEETLTINFMMRIIA